MIIQIRRIPKSALVCVLPPSFFFSPGFSFVLVLCFHVHLSHVGIGRVLVRLAPHFLSHKNVLFPPNIFQEFLRVQVQANFSWTIHRYHGACGRPPRGRGRCSTSRKASLRAPWRAKSTTSAPRCPPHPTADVLSRTIFCRPCFFAFDCESIPVQRWRRRKHGWCLSSKSLQYGSTHFRIIQSQVIEQCPRLV